MTQRMLWEFVFGTGSVPVAEGLLTLLAFICVGIFVGWQNSRRTPLTFISQFCYGTLLVRIVQSYWMFGHPMREGLWPALWVTGGLLGLRMSRRRVTK